MNIIKKGITQELGVRIGKMEKRTEYKMEDRLGGFETKLETEFKQKREELALKIEEGKTQAVQMREKLEDDIGSTNKIIDKVDEDLEGYPICVDAIVLQQVEELGFCQRQDGSLEQKLEVRTILLVVEDHFKITFNIKNVVVESVNEKKYIEKDGNVFSTN